MQYWLRLNEAVAISVLMILCCTFYPGHIHPGPLHDDGADIEI